MGASYNILGGGMATRRRKTKEEGERELLERALRLVSDHVGELGGASASAAVRALREAAERADRGPDFKRRARVLVLFADLAGYTPYSESRDPEEVSRFVGGLWDRLDHLVHARGGRVLQHLGDAVLAVWGEEKSREDDAERAFAAGLEMLDGLPAYLAELGLVAGASAPGGIRVGLHAGPAFAGPVGSLGEYAVLGDTVNTASRLQSAAAPGELVFSEAVLRLLPSPPERARELAPLRLKGKAEALAAWAIAAEAALPAAAATALAPSRASKGAPSSRPLRHRAFRPPAESEGPESTAFPSPLLELRAELEAAPRGVSLPRLLLIRASSDSGAGASALARGFAASLPPAWLRLGAVAPSEGGSSPGSLLRALAAAWAGVYESDGAAAARAKLEAARAGIPEPGSAGDAAAPSSCPSYPEGASLAEALGFGGARGSAKRGRTSPGAGAAIPPAAAGRELLVDWLLALGGERPRVLVLEELDEADSSSLAVLRAFLERPAPAPVLLLGTAAGPVELPGRVLDAEPEPSAAPPLDPCAELDRLERADLELLESGAVFGMAFWDTAISTRAAARLEELARRGFVAKSERSRIAGSGEWRFASRALRDSVYDRILLAERAERHEAAARWLLDHFGGAVGREGAFVARHFESAGRAAEAAALYAAAGDFAAERGDPEAAAALYRRALAAGGLEAGLAARVETAAMAAEAAAAAERP